MRNLEDALKDYRESGSHASGIGDPNTYCACIPYMYIHCTYALQHTRNINYGHLRSSMDNNILTIIIISVANILCSRIVILCNPVSFLVPSTSGT